MTTEVQKVNKKSKKEKLKVKHQEEGSERELEENEQIVENERKSKKSEKKKENITRSEKAEEECLVEKLEITEKVKGEKRQLDEDESTNKKKPKKSKKKKDETTLNTIKNKNLDDSSIANEIEDEDEEEKPKKEPSIRQLKREKAAIREAEAKEAGKQGNAKKALNYVSMWKHAKSEWKFNKVMQTWLVHNLLDENYVPDNQYSTVLEYFEGCKGSARKQLIDKAMAVIKKVEEQVEKKEKEEEEDQDEKIVETTEYKRARQLLQALPTET